MSGKKEEKNNITTALEITLKNSDLHQIISDFSEIGIDHMLSDKLLKEIPIISTISGLVSLGLNIQDRLFLKKILSFLASLKDISPEQRKRFIEDIDNSKKFRVKVGEKLLYIIDSCEDFEISELVSMVFKYCLEEKITYEEFLKTSSVLKDMNKVDFDWFVKGRKRHYFDLGDVGDLMHTGLFELYFEDISVVVKERGDFERMRTATKWRESEKYETDVDGGMSVHLTRAGEIILEIFCETYKKPRTIRV